MEVSLLKHVDLRPLRLAVGESPEADRGQMASISLDSYEKSRSEKGLLLVFDLARSNWMKTEIAGVP